MEPKIEVTYKFTHKFILLCPISCFLEWTPALLLCTSVVIAAPALSSLPVESPAKVGSELHLEKSYFLIELSECVSSLTLTLFHLISFGLRQ